MFSSLQKKLEYIKIWDILFILIAKNEVFSKNYYKLTILLSFLFKSGVQSDINL